MNLASSKLFSKPLKALTSKLFVGRAPLKLLALALEQSLDVGPLHLDLVRGNVHMLQKANFPISLRKQEVLDDGIEGWPYLELHHYR